MNIHADLIDLIEQYAQDWKEDPFPYKGWEYNHVFNNPKGNGWKQCTGHPNFHNEELLFRRSKPRTFMVGDVEVRPVQGGLPYAKCYYTPAPPFSTFYAEFMWGDTHADILRLKRGLIHLNKEDAIAHGKALAALTGGE